MRNARKTGREWMYHHLASQVQSPVPKAPATPVPPKRTASQSFFFFSFPITKDLGEVSQNQLTNINTMAVMNVRSVYIVTVFGILWWRSYDATQCHTVLLQWFWGVSFCWAVKLCRNVWKCGLLKLVKRRQKKWRWTCIRNGCGFEVPP